MIAYKCDICGKFYDGNVQDYEKVDPITFVGIGFAPTSVRFSNVDNTRVTPNHDICNDCLIRFKKLINEIRDGIK